MKLYYYTTTETMRYIVTKGDIYATNVRYLNDSEEYSNGLREVRNLLNMASGFGFADWEKKAMTMLAHDTYKMMLKSASNIYSISFSKATDLLSQWHMYAKESGVQLTMHFDNGEKYEYFTQPESENKTVEPQERKKRILKKKPVYYLTKVGMPPTEYNRVGEEVLNVFSNILKENGGEFEDEMISTCKMLAPFIKNYGFRQEKEVRAIFVSNENELPIQYRNDRGVLKPYLDIEMENGWPISGIMVGPGRNQNQVFQSICHFLEHSELKINKVNDSVLVKAYFDGMKRYSLPTSKIEQCKKQVLQIDESIKRMGVKYSERVQETLQNFEFDDEEKKNLQSYIENNYFCDKGIIVSKSIWPYEF